MREFCGCLLNLGEILSVHYILEETQRPDFLTIFHGVYFYPSCFVCLLLLVLRIKCQFTEGYQMTFHKRSSADIFTL